MSNLITLTCPACGGHLEVTNEAERYVCVHCGNAHVIDPGERVDSLRNEVEILKYDERIRKTETELEGFMEQQRRAWQLYEGAEEQLAERRAKKRKGWAYCGLGLFITLAGLLPGSSIFLPIGGVFIMGGLTYLVSDDAEARSAQEAAMQQVAASRYAIKQKQSQLAQYREKQLALRLQNRECAASDQR